MSEQHHLADEDYKVACTGYPKGIQYRVEDPMNGLSYDFDGFVDGHLVWTIADYTRQFDGAGPLEGGLEGAYRDSAGLQNAVRQGYPVTWFVQRAADANRLRAMIEDAGYSSIFVRHLPIE
ncbi:hypothetical protein [Microbacterium sp. NPDC055357]